MLASNWSFYPASWLEIFILFVLLLAGALFLIVVVILFAA
jgi:hypothetical protein